MIFICHLYYFFSFMVVSLGTLGGGWCFIRFPRFSDLLCKIFFLLHGETLTMIYEVFDLGI